MSTAVLQGGYVREDIRLGNEALTRQDLDTASSISTGAGERRCHRHAETALRPIVSGDCRTPTTGSRATPTLPGKTRTRRKATDAKQQAEAPAHSLCPSP